MSSEPGKGKERVGVEAVVMESMTNREKLGKQVVARNRLTKAQTEVLFFNW